MIRSNARLVAISVSIFIIILVTAVCAEVGNSVETNIFAEDPASPDSIVVLENFNSDLRKSASRSEIEFTELGSALWGRPHYGQISGDHLFVAFPHGLVIYDITDSIIISELSRVAIDGANDVEVAGNYVYVGCGHDNTNNAGIAALRVVDISEITAPALVAEVPTMDRVRGLYVDGDLLYLATAWEGIMAFDITVPTNPLLLGTFGEFTHPYDIIVRDTIGYTNLTNEFRIINVADPANISLISTYDPLGYPRRIDLRDNHAFVGCWEGLMIVDISNPSSPTSAAYMPPNGLESFTDMHLVGDRVYLGVRYDDINLVDITSVFSPTIVEEFGDSTQYFTRTCVQARGDYAYVIDSGYIGVLAAHEGFGLQMTQQMKLPGKIFDADIVGQYAYVCATDGLWILDLAGSSTPEVIGFAASAGRNIDIQIIGDTAYMAGGSSGVSIFDIADPAAPTLISRTGIPGEAVRSVEKNDTLLVLATYDHLVILNIADPENPVIISQKLVPNPHDAKLKDSIIFLASFNMGISIVGVSDLQNPVYYTSFYNTPGFVRNVHLRGDTLFALVSVGGFGVTGDYIDIFNVADPFSPSLLSTVELPGFTSSVDFKFEGDYAYVASMFYGVAAVNVANAESPRFAGSRYTPGTTGGVGVQGNRLLAADGFGVVLFELNQGYICGNVDNIITGSSPVDISDLTYLVDFLFNFGPPPPFMEAANVDGVSSGGVPVDISDLTYFVDYLFAGGPAPICE